MESADIQRVVAPIAVGIHNAVRCDCPLDNRHQRGGAGIVDPLGADLAAALEDAKHNNLARCASPPLALSDAAEVALTQFNDGLEYFMLNVCQTICDELPGLVIEQGSLSGWMPRKSAAERAVTSSTKDSTSFNCCFLLNLKRLSDIR